jgi:xanthine dehydrogenase large subunit
MLDKTQSEEAGSATLRGDVHQALRHDSAHLHVSGQARYIDDIPEPAGCLHLYIGTSTRAHARIVNLDLSAVRAAPGVVLVLTAKDIPGINDVGAVIHDEPVFAEGEVICQGQSLFAVTAVTRKAARLAALKAKVTYEELPAYITIEQARAANSLIEPSQIMSSGNAQESIKGAPLSLSGAIEMGGQDHFYLEGQIALATPGENGSVHVFSSTQNPTEAQHLVAHVLGIPSNQVTVEVRRMGGGFGGKETQSALLAAASSLAAVRTGRPVKFRLDRDDDMIVTGKRHDFSVSYSAGFDAGGRLAGASFDLASRCGASTDLSMAINDRAMFHADNCYFLGAARIVSHRLRTHTVSNTAFRGFGGPQGMVAVERMMDEIAFRVGRDPLDVRLDNLYAGPGRNETPYGQIVEDNIARELMETLAESANYRARRAEIEAFNKRGESPVIRRGIALTPVKFGISFTTTFLNQAGALVQLYSDGSIQLNHGGTEMGQGLMIKVAQVVANEFQVDIDRIRIMSTSTEKVPNTSATAASSGTDLNGMAAQAAARKIKRRLAAFVAQKDGVTPDEVLFANNRVFAGETSYAFEEVVRAAYLGRVSMSATGFYKTPKIHYDRATHRGHPFYYFAYGAAVTEVEIDTLTGENRVLRTDILHDVGKSLNPAIDLGQIEGGFVQGMGWLTTEELVFDAQGRLRTHAPSTYKIPACSDRPKELNIKLWDAGENREPTIHRSKAVGEPPFMLAISVLSALTHAVSGSTGHRIFPRLDAPATPERILMAVETARHQLERS